MNKNISMHNVKFHCLTVMFSICVLPFSTKNFAIYLYTNQTDTVSADGLAPFAAALRFFFRLAISFKLLNVSDFFVCII